jgi:excisionase family DNA binding protein
MIMKKPTRKQPQSIACPADCTRLHNLPQAAYLLGVSVSTLRREIDDGKLQVSIVRRRRMLSHAVIREYLERNSMAEFSPH